MRHALGLGALVLAVLLAALGCGGDEDVDASGDYTIAVTNGDNGCAFPNWTEGATASGIPFTVDQDDRGNVTGTIEGLVGAYVAVLLGSREFSGTVNGSRLSLTLFGTVPYNQDSCTYTIHAEMTANLDGDALEGRIEYRPDTNGDPSCGELETCVSIEDFNGTRPPT